MRPHSAQVSATDYSYGNGWLMTGPALDLVLETLVAKTVTRAAARLVPEMKNVQATADRLRLTGASWSPWSA